MDAIPGFEREFIEFVAEAKICRLRCIGFNALAGFLVLGMEISVGSVCAEVAESIAAAQFEALIDDVPIVDGLMD